ncbi:hypothetical protein HAX54_041632, partial [Datura stramonium]|nr:hypothetical protein [Datura stramonium]
MVVPHQERRTEANILDLTLMELLNSELGDIGTSWWPVKVWQTQTTNNVIGK